MRDPFQQLVDQAAEHVAAGDLLVPADFLAKAVEAGFCSDTFADAVITQVEGSPTQSSDEQPSFI